MFEIVYPCSYLNLSIYTEFMNNVFVVHDSRSLSQRAQNIKKGLKSVDAA